MYNEFNASIAGFSQEHEAGDYWYDCGILESMKILEQFSDNDWDLLLKALNNKSVFWQKRFVECLGDLNHSYELQALLELVSAGNKDLYGDCIDALKSLDLSKLNQNTRKHQLIKLTILIDKSEPAVKKILAEYNMKIESQS